MNHEEQHQPEPFERSEEHLMGAASPVPPPPPPPPPPTKIVLEQPKRRWWSRLLWSALFLSLFFNFVFYQQIAEYYGGGTGPNERFYSGNETAEKKIALIKINGTIMPPFTDRIIKSIRRAKKDARVKGVVLVIDSPGGLVADSHQIYHELTLLRKKKPVFVSMKRLAASGGYYVAMGAGTEGKIFAEPTTWTGSIGVIIPRYDLTELVKRLGIQVEPLKTGSFKDTLSPFRPMSPEEKKLWSGILNDAYQRFIQIIAENRPKLDVQKVKALATGQIFTAEQAKQNGLVDEIGFLEDVLKALARKLNLKEKEYRVVEYYFQPSMWELLSGELRARDPHAVLQQWLESTVPQALYYCSWLNLPLPATER